MRRCLSGALALLCLIALAMPMRAQNPPGADAVARQSEALRVYLDCHTEGCDRDFFITELAFVNWTRDRADAEVHLLVTSLETGAGGTQYSVNVAGRGRFVGKSDTLVANVGPNSTEDDRRQVLAKLFKFGLMRYVANSPEAARLKITYDAPPTTSVAAKVHDPWDFWVYRVGVNGFFNGESQASFANLNANLSASRTTELWKASLSAFSRYSQSEYTLSDGSKSKFIRRNSEANARLVKSVNEHWSAGATASAGHAEFRNQDFYASARATIEYNFYPWKEATQRQFVASYSLGPSWFRYIEESIYLKTSESVPQHQILLANSTKARWGSVDLSARWQQYLHDPSKTNAAIGGEVSLRLSKGLSLNLFGSASRVRDQLYLAKGELADDEILTQQRALATSFSYFGSIGVSYTFGSIYNTIVNPRLDRLNGGFFF